MSDKRRTFAVIDGNSLMHRAFHAVPPTMNAPDGRPTNAIFGFLNMFLKMIDAFNPDGVVVAFDKGKPRVRMEMLPQYKAQRPPMDPDLHAQFPMIKELLTALNVPILQSEGWEGDDILGTMARLGEEAGCDMLLVTGDRDMYQLVTEHVNVVSTRKGLSDVAIMTPESVDDLYHGITPALVPDFYGLKGDTSDNIPGVPGIGPKKASALIAQYGSLDEVIAHADEVKGKMGENLRAHIDDALLSRKVATIRTDAPVELDFEATSFPAFSADEVSAALGTLGITAMQNRFLALIGGEGGAAAAGEEDEPEPLSQQSTAPQEVEKQEEAAAPAEPAAVQPEEETPENAAPEAETEEQPKTEETPEPEKTEDKPDHPTGDPNHQTGPALTEVPGAIFSSPIVRPADAPRPDDTPPSATPMAPVMPSFEEEDELDAPAMPLPPREKPQEPEAEEEAPTVPEEPQPETPEAAKQRAARQKAMRALCALRRMREQHGLQDI